AALPAAAQEAALWELEPGAASVRLDPAVLSELQAGARVALPLPGKRLQARLDGAQYLPGGDLSWQGAVLTDGMAPNAELHVLVLTVGETALFGTVSSPAGLWQ